MEKYAVPGQESFFGYYDKSPFSADGRFLLAGTVNPSRRDEGTRHMQVGTFDRVRGGEFHVLGQTRTWCWQQGCRLQWLPGTDSQRIIYNVDVGDRVGAIVQRFPDGEILADYEWPIYDVDPTERFAITLNFARLNRLRPGYGYALRSDSTEMQQAPESDGIRVLDLRTGKCELVIGLRRLRSLLPLSSMSDAEHYVNCLCFNPKGTRFLFLHVWTKGQQRYSRLVTSDLTGRDVVVLTHGEYISHYTWKSAEEILATTNRPFEPTEYWVYRDRSDRRRRFVHSKLRRDGHPTFLRDGRLIVDTYPDDFGDQRLLLCDGMKAHELGCFFSPGRYFQEERCDLHPRPDASGRFVCIDSAHEGRRAMYVLPIPDTSTAHGADGVRTSALNDSEVRGEGSGQRAQSESLRADEDSYQRG